MTTIKRWTRTIVIEGNPRWVDATVKNSWITNRFIKRCGGMHNSILCTEMKFERIEVDDE